MTLIHPKASAAADYGGLTHSLPFRKIASWVIFWYDRFMAELFTKVREFVKKSFNDEAQLLHFDRTVHWVKVLNPNADEGILIAAIGHDIERAFREDMMKIDGKDIKFTDDQHKQQHQSQGAEILGEFLEESGADKKLIIRVKHLILKHEVGGDEGQNLLKDADSLSFVENNTSIFLSRFDTLGYEKIKGKFEWMYNRITSKKAKQIATPFYEKMMAELEILHNKGIVKS